MRGAVVIVDSVRPAIHQTSERRSNPGPIEDEPILPPPALPPREPIIIDSIRPIPQPDDDSG